MKNLAYCCSMVQVDLQDYTTHSRQRILQYAILGLRKLGIKGGTNIKVAYVTPNDVFAAKLPMDFSKHVKVGFNYRGRWVTLTVNDNLFTNVPKDECGDDVLDFYSSALDSGFSHEQYGSFDWVPHYRAGNYVGEMYSVSGGFSSLGGFKIDYDNNTIHFDPAYPLFNKYAIEYITDNSDASESTLISPLAVEPICSYVHWRLKEHDDRIHENIKQAKWGNFNRELGEFQDIMHEFSTEELMDALNQSYHQPNMGN